jgi:hypothetical protein
VARFYSNENIALQVVMELRRLDNNVLTPLEAGNANTSVPDPEVLSFASCDSESCCTIAVTFFSSIYAEPRTIAASFSALLTRTSPVSRIE